MRISTLITTASLASFITAATFVAGESAVEPPLLLATSAPLPEPTEPVATSEPTVAAEPQPSVGQVPADQPTATNEPAASDPSAGSQAQEPVTEPVPAEPAPAPAVETVIVDSDPITYKYGTVQLRLTSVGNQITDVAVLQGDASYGRDVAYATLISATLKYQSTNYGNVSGATFTTEAFKLAVESALAKN